MLPNEAQPSLDDHRNMLFSRLQKLSNFYGWDPEAQQLAQQLQGRASGTDAPFGQGTVDRLVGQESSAASAGLGMEQDEIRQYFANAGLSGSGVEGSSLVNARRRASAATRAARRDITSRADLANFQARQDAQQQLQTYVAQRQQALQDAVFQESQYRSQINATGDAQNVNQATSAGQQQAQQPQAQAPAPAPAPAPLTGSHGSNPGYNSEAAARRAEETRMRWELARGPTIKQRNPYVGTPYTLTGAPRHAEFREVPNPMYGIAQARLFGGGFA